MTAPIPELLLLGRKSSSEGFYEIRSNYVETYWLPVVGPSALWILRRLDGWLLAGSVNFCLRDLAASVGLGHGTAQNSPVVRTLHRLHSFSIVDLRPMSILVPTRLAPINTRQLARLPEWLQSTHLGNTA